MQNELNALAGPSAGPNGGQIYIDGFTGGQLPPKSSIREIRINQNPFSAQFDKLGYGRIEILTKPGTNTLHGMVLASGNDSTFNSLNPFVTSEPPYYSTFFTGNAGGALTKSSSWFASVFRRDNESNSIVNADLLNSSGSTYNYTAAVANPQSRLDVSPRFDFQLGANNTLTVRYMFDRQVESNDGVSGFSLETQAYNVANHENTLQLSDTQVLGANVVNETHFQYMGDRESQVAQNSAPSVTVQGAFSGGGNSMGTVRDNQDHYELQNNTMVTKGAHTINFGGRLRFTHDASYSTSGFNGQYTYASLSAYAAQTPAQYSVTAGNAGATVNYFDLGMYFQDDYKARPNLTLSYGLRYETQDWIGEHGDWAPRFSFAWAPAGRRKQPSEDRDPRRLWLVLRSLCRGQRPSEHPPERNQPAAVCDREPELLSERSLGLAVGVAQHSGSHSLSNRSALQSLHQHAGGHGSGAPVRQVCDHVCHVYQLARRSSVSNRQHQRVPALDLQREHGHGYAPQRHQREHRTVPVGRRVQPEPTDGELLGQRQAAHAFRFLQP